MKVTVMLPAYNEADDLPPLLERVGKALSGRVDYRILVVDDGSSDGTVAAAERAAGFLPIELVRHPRNMGLGAAMRTGLRAASKGEGVVVTMDADNSHDPALIPAMLARLEEGYDVVIASRFQPGGQEVGVAQHRKLLSHSASGMLKIVVPYAHVRDYTCGYRAYRVELLRRLIDTFGDGFVRENGFSCMLELLINCRAVRARASEVPLVLRYDMKSGASKMKVFRTIWRYAVTISRGFLPVRWRAVRPGGGPASAS